MSMKFEWDIRKNKANLQKHGISFEEACEIVKKPVLSRIDDSNDYGEIR